MLKDNLLLAFLLIFILGTSVAIADHKPTTEYDGLEWSQLPVICGTSEAVNEYLVHNKFELQNLSVGKENASPGGQSVYMVSYFINEDKTQSMAVITAPSGVESCMLYRSFELMIPGMML
tara:strand:+ start:352 stop:711 length:360 start_codon:yes stop_codon:yes gene_type:complete